MRDNKAQSRFELEFEGRTVFADYRRKGSDLEILHVESPVELRGKGAAGKLMQDISDYAEAGSLNIVAICSYAVAWLKRKNG